MSIKNKDKYLLTFEDNLEVSSLVLLSNEKANKTHNLIIKEKKIKKKIAFKKMFEKFRFINLKKLPSIHATGNRVLSNISYTEHKYYNFLEKITLSVWKYKIAIFLIAIVFAILGAFFAIFPRLFKGQKQDNYLDYFQNSEINNNPSSSQANFEDIIYSWFRQSENPANSGKTFFAVFCEKNASYMRYLINISETEWKYFVWLNLGHYWSSKWKNYGPLESLAKDAVNQSSNIIPVMKVFFLDHKDPNYSKYSTSVHSFIGSFKANDKNINLKHEKIQILNYPVIPAFGHLVRQAIIGNQIISNNYLSKAFVNYDDIEKNPFILKINKGIFYMLSGLPTYSQIKQVTT